MNETIYTDYLDDGRIAVIYFNRPHVMNALNRSAMERFAAVVADLADVETLRAVILTGAGTRAFCSGGDLQELSQLTTQDQALDFITLMGDALRRLETLPVPVIAAINGYALGGGSEIAMACDMRIVDSAARMGFVQARLALTPGWGAGQRLLAVVGYARAMELLLRAEPLPADELLALNLVNRVTASGGALDAALALARSFTRWDHQVIISIKRLLRAGIERPPADAAQIERDIFPPLWAADAHLNAVADFLHAQKQKKGD
ncbi:MAG: enoyl-CoA hydratase/isomerase family protein [Anaerolineaceae bacterium]|nr:MAG: enoyl-CoA hydratase/isomerase family protein [Anaerolineaceae bacterium]